MKRSLLLLLVLVPACGHDGSPPAPSSKVADKSSDHAASSKPAVSPTCKAARTLLGPRAACVETPLADLTTSAGTITRVHDGSDPIHTPVYVLAKPSGELVAGRGSGQSSGGLVDQVTAGLDPAKTSPELLARLYAALFVESAVVRCIDPADKLTVGKCAPPSRDASGVVTFIMDEFPDPRVFNRDDHVITRQRFAIEGGKFTSKDSDYTDVYKKDPPSTRPASLPPLPEMTKAPDWAAAPAEAAADDSAKLCAAAGEKLGDYFKQHHCQAFGYPSVSLPNGKLFYLANDAGERWAFAFRQPDGTILAGQDLVEHYPLASIIKDYDPAVVPPATLLAANLLLHPYPARIRCVGSDTIKDVDCKAPAAHKTADGVHLTAIIEELPLPDEHGTIHDPAIRDYAWDLQPGGGFSGDGARLVDLRDGE